MLCLILDHNLSKGSDQSVKSLRVIKRRDEWVSNVQANWERLRQPYLSFEICVRPGFQLFRVIYQLSWFCLWCYGTYFWSRTIEMRDMKDDRIHYNEFFQGCWDITMLYDESSKYSDLFGSVYLVHQVFTWIFELDIICRFWIYARSSKNITGRLFFWTEILMVSPTILLGYGIMAVNSVNTYGVMYDEYYQQILGWVRLGSFITNANDMRNVNLKSGKRSTVIEIVLTVSAIVLSLGSLLFVIDGVREPDIHRVEDPRTVDTIVEFFYFSVVTLSTIGYGDYSPETLMARLVFMVVVMITWTVIPAKLSKLLHLNSQPRTEVGTIPAMTTESQAHAVSRRSANVITKRLEHDLSCNAGNRNSYCIAQLRTMKQHVDDTLATNMLNKNIVIVAGNLDPSKLEVFITELAANWRNDCLMHFPRDSILRFGDDATLHNVLAASHMMSKQTLHVVYMTSYSPELFDELIPLMYTEFDVNLSVMWQHFLLDKEDPMSQLLADRTRDAQAISGSKLGDDRKFTSVAISCILEAESIYLLPNFSISDGASAERRDELVIKLAESVKHIRGSLDNVTAAFQLQKSMNRISGLSNSVSISTTAQSLLMASVLRHSGIHSLFGLICSHASFTTLNLDPFINPSQHAIDSVDENDFLPEVDDKKKGKYLKQHDNLICDCLMMAGQQLLQVICLIPDKLEGIHWFLFVHMMKKYFEICVILLVVWEDDGQEGYSIPSRDYRMGTSKVHGKRIRGVLVLCKDESIRAFYRVFLHMKEVTAVCKPLQTAILDVHIGCNSYDSGIRSWLPLQLESENVGNKDGWKQRIIRKWGMRQSNDDEQLADEVLKALVDANEPPVGRRTIYDDDSFLSSNINPSYSEYDMTEIKQPETHSIFKLATVGSSLITVRFSLMLCFAICKTRMRSGAVNSGSMSLFEWHQLNHCSDFSRALGQPRGETRLVHFLKWPQNLEYFLNFIVKSCESHLSSRNRDPFLMRVVMMTDTVPRDLFSAMLRLVVSPRVQIQLILIDGDWTDKSDLIWSGAANTESIGLQCTSPAFPVISSSRLWDHILQHSCINSEFRTVSSDVFTSSLDDCAVDEGIVSNEKFFDETVLRSCLLINEIHEHANFVPRGGSFSVQLDFVPTGYLSTTVKEPPLSFDKGQIQAVMEGKCLTVEMLYGMCVKSAALSSLPDVSKLTEYINLHNMYDIKPISNFWAGRQYEELWDSFCDDEKIVIALHLYSFDEAYIERVLNCNYKGDEDDEHGTTIPTDCYPQYTWAVSPPSWFKIPDFPRSRSSQFPIGYMVYFSLPKKVQGLVEHQDYSGYGTLLRPISPSPVGDADLQPGECPNGMFEQI
eukprot:GHVH01016996.1.p1 GENE.GHVH01016996.1~~GHVH01016996.1.p1  ORF type:complete len:1340 (-),score=182.68 GHVH01016996.1:230-4249(-)